MRRLLPVIFALSAAGCGGGSSNGGGSPQLAPPPPPPAPNNAPVARADSAPSALEGSVVTLDGSGSSDADGQIQSYAWSQTSGPAVTLDGAASAQASFTAPEVSSETTFGFRLLVTDADNAEDSDATSVVIRPAEHAVSGAVSVPQGTSVDGDVNDPNAPYTPNDLPGQAQLAMNPVTIGGYVNVAGAGEPGPRTASGDTSDFYRVDVVAGQTITLLVGDPATGDPDLYLWDAAGTNILDASLNVGAVETLAAPITGEILVEAHAFSGASNYVLVIGQTQTAGAAAGLRLSDPIVPGELIARYENSGLGSTAAVRSAAPLGLVHKSGTSGGPVLLGLADPKAGALSAGAGTPRALDRRRALASDADRRKLETLLAAKRLSRDASIEYAHPNYLARATAVPNDQHYPLQWHYPLIDLPAAWDVTTGNADVTVAVLDTGVLLDHPDLEGQLVDGYDFIQDPARAADGDGIDPDADDPGDSDGPFPSTFHGTHVAGTVGATSNNARGVSGVAWGVRIMPVRVLGRGGGTTYDILQGVRYAAGLPNDSGQTPGAPADVINLSLGGLGPCTQAAQEVFGSARAAGSVVVVAAGNDSIDAAGSSPANCTDVFAVSAVDINRNLAPYSNFGSTIDVAAPGGDASVDRNGDGYPDGVLSTVGDDGSGTMSFSYQFHQGTSMASPHVAGVFALMRSVNPDLTPGQIEQMLAAGELTDNVGAPASHGHGLINARKAVFAALNALGAPPVETSTLELSPQSLGFGSTFTHAELTVGNGGGGSLQAQAPVTDAAWLSVSPVSVSADNLGSYAVTVDRSGLADGTYVGTVSVQSDAGNAQTSVIMQVSSALTGPDAGYLYILLIDPDSGDVVRQFSSGGDSAGEYPYDFADVPDGTYEVVAGTDFDNDLFICDPGETCGAYRTLDQPQPVELDTDRTGIDFQAGHVIAIPEQASAGGYRPPLPARAREGLEKSVEAR